MTNRMGPKVGDGFEWKPGLYDKNEQILAVKYMDVDGAENMSDEEWERLCIESHRRHGYKATSLFPEYQKQEYHAMNEREKSKVRARFRASYHRRKESVKQTVNENA